MQISFRLVQVVRKEFVAFRSVLFRLVQSKGKDLALRSVVILSSVQVSLRSVQGIGEELLIGCFHKDLIGRHCVLWRERKCA